MPTQIPDPTYRSEPVDGAEAIEVLELIDRRQLVESLQPESGLDTLNSPLFGAEIAQLADQLRPVMLKLSRHLRREALKVGISALDAQLLGIIKKMPGSGVSDLADLEQMSRPAMSVHIKRLEASGWLIRQADGPDADRRRVRLTLSRKGEEALSAIRRSRNDWLESRLTRLSEPDLAALGAALEPLMRLVEFKS